MPERPLGSDAPPEYDYEKASRFAQSRLFVTPSVDLHHPQYWSWVPLRVWAKLRQMMSHLQLIGTACRHRHLDLILVKGFSTLWLAVIAPFIWHNRRRILLTMHHNLQFAHQRPLGKWILRLLSAANFRFAVLETLDGVAELGIQPREGQFFVLRAPIAEPLAIGGRPASSRAGIAVIGNLRPEKSAEDLLRALVQARDRGQIGTRLILGCPDDATLKRWRGAGVDGINTSAYSDYLLALASCEVVVLNYAAAKYRYRASGVISDAVAMGAVVVCPNFPVFRRQITEPVTVGVVFNGSEDLISAIHAALELRSSQPGNSQLWSRARSPKEFSRRLDEFVLNTARSRPR